MKHSSVKIRPLAPILTSADPVSSTYSRLSDTSVEPPTALTLSEPSSVLFADDFDSENGGSGELNYFGFTNWNVTSGSVDLIGNGFADFLPGNGLYVDLDGTTFSAGTLESKTTFALVPATYRLEFRLAGSQRGDSNRVDVRLGEVYSETFEPQSNAPFTTITRDIIVSTQTSGKLVFQSFGNDNIGFLLDNVRLLTDITEPRLFNISPDHGGNTGNVTVSLSGINLPAGTATVKLHAQGQSDIVAISTAVISATQVTATFDLTGAGQGLRDAVVTFFDGQSMTLQDAFTIEPGSAPQLWVDIIGRGTIRPNLPETYTIVYRNQGNVDAPAPLLELSSPNAVKFALSGGRPFQNGPFRIFAGGQIGPAGTLPPGTYTLQVKVQSPAMVGQIQLDLSIVETTGQVFDWNRLASEGMPAGADANDWSARVVLARSVIGESLDNVMTTLRNSANESGEGARAFFDFDEFLSFTVASYGTNGEEFSRSVAAGYSVRKSLMKSHHARKARMASESAPVNLITIAESPNPTATFVITHGLGGLRGFNNSRTDILEAAAAIQFANPNANVYIVDWTGGANVLFPLPGGRMIPRFFKAASNTVPAGNAAFDLLRAKQEQGFFNPETATFIGESYGNSVNNRIAERFEAGAFGKVQRALLLNPANILALPLFLKSHFEQSIAVSTDSFFDNKFKIANINLYLETDTLNAVEQHISGMRRVKDHPELVHIFDNPLLQSTSIPFVSDGRIKLNGSLDTTPFSFLFGSSVNQGLFLSRALWRTLTIIIVNSRDPNDKVGPVGVTESRYVSGRAPLTYNVFFENEATATAAAQGVVVSDLLDMSKVDQSTFGFGPITFGNKTVLPPPGLSEFTTNVDLRPANDLIVHVDARLETQTGLVTWKFTSIDPATGLPTDDPLAGFLPPNTNPPDGEGNVVFSVMPKQDLLTGTEVRNQASIVFDTNAAIQTPIWMNTIANPIPTSNADLSITNSVSPNTVVTGSNVTYTITVTNNGPGDASDVTVTDNLPAATTFLSCSASGGQVCGGSANMRTVIFPMLAPNSSETITIVATLSCSVGNWTVISNEAIVSSSSSDPNQNNNSTTASISASNPPPSIDCPANIVQPNDPGTGSAVVNYAIPTAADNCSSVAVGCSHPSGITFPVGATTVICTATDAAGSQSACSFSVTVADTEPPTVTNCASNKTLATNSSGQIALPNLTGEVTATDNFTPASALTITQSPAAGTMIGIGTTPVTITVRDAANNASTCITTVSVSRFVLRGFVVFSKEHTLLRVNAKIITGSVGANTSLPDPNGPPDDKEEVEIGEGVQFLGAGSSVVGDTIRLRANAQVQNVFYNELFNTHGNIFGSRLTPLLLPVVTMPMLPPISPGSQDIEVQTNQTKTLAPGHYRKITVKNRGTLILTGGIYEVSSFDIRQETKILFKGPTEVRVKNELDTDVKTYIGPDPSVPTLSASQIIFYAEGTDDRGRHHAEDEELTPTVVQIGQRNTVLVNIFASNGTVWLKSNTKATGAFIGKRTRIGDGVELRLASAF